MSEPPKETPQPADTADAARGPVRGNGAGAEASTGNGSGGKPVTAAPAAAAEPPARHLGESGLNLKPSGRVHVAVRAEASPRAAEQTAIADPVFSCRDVNVYYGAKQALKNVTIDVGRRQVLAMIGPSGCGKSTFLRCLNRMNDTIPPPRGDGGVTPHGCAISHPQPDAAP